MKIRQMRKNFPVGNSDAWEKLDNLQEQLSSDINNLSRTYASLTSSSFRGPEARSPRACLSEAISDSEPSDSSSNS